MLEPKHVPANESVTSAILDHIRLPAFLVENRAGLLYTNAAGMAALKDADCFKQVDNVLCAIQQTDNVRLRTAIADTCASGLRQTFMLNDARDPPPNIVAVIPFHDDDASSKNHAMVFLQKCQPADDAFASALRQLFRLSVAETTIAAALVSGIDVEHIAEMRNAKITTVRTQIAAMLLKTRTRRQGELIALFSRVCTHLRAHKRASNIAHRRKPTALALHALIRYAWRLRAVRACVNDVPKRWE
jgi:DNA-binding CsgD family transcriptional regulator